MRVVLRGLRSELLSKPNENTFWPADVAEPVDVFIVDDLVDHRRTEMTWERK